MKLAALEDKVDPFLIKEARQLLGGRVYSVILLLLLLVLTGVAMYSIKSMEKEDVKSYITIIIQVAIYASLIHGVLIASRQKREVDSDESFILEYQYPRHLMWGRVLSIIMQNAILLLPILPFVAIAVVLPGISAYQVAMIIYFFDDCTIAFLFYRIILEVYWFRGVGYIAPCNLFACYRINLLFLFKSCYISLFS